MIPPARVARGIESMWSPEPTFSVARQSPRRAGSAYVKQRRDHHADGDRIGRLVNDCPVNVAPERGKGRLKAPFIKDPVMNIDRFGPRCPSLTDREDGVGKVEIARRLGVRERSVYRVLAGWKAKGALCLSISYVNESGITLYGENWGSFITLDTKLF
jgi:hypothetical protein